MKTTASLFVIGLALICLPAAADDTIVTYNVISVVNMLESRAQFALDGYATCDAASKGDECDFRSDDCASFDAVSLDNVKCQFADAGPQKHTLVADVGKTRVSVAFTMDLVDHRRGTGVGGDIPRHYEKHCELREVDTHLLIYCQTAE